MSNDPCKSCSLYKEIGCTHVDGFMCDFPSCEMLVEYERLKEKLNEENQ